MSSTSGSIRHPAALALLLFASTLGVMGGAIVVPVLELIRRDLEVSGMAAGLIITTHGLTIAVTSPLTGWLIDRFGVRLPLASGLLLYAVAGGAGMVASSYPALIASRVLFGAGAAMVFTGTTVALLALYGGPERDRVMGWRGTATALGGVVWPLLAGGLGGLSWHAPFGLYLIGLPVGLAALALMPETREPRGRDRVGVFTLLRQRPQLLAIFTLMFLMFVMMYALAVFLPQRLGELGVEQPFLISLLMLPMAAAASVIGLVYARIRTHASHLALLRVSAATWIAGFLLLGTVGDPLAVAVATLLFGLGHGVAFPSLTVLIGQITPAPLLGRANAISATAVFVGQFASPLVLGPVIGATSIATGFLVVAGLAGAILLTLLLAPNAFGQPATADQNEDAVV